MFLIFCSGFSCWICACWMFSVWSILTASLLLPLFFTSRLWNWQRMFQVRRLARPSMLFLSSSCAVCFKLSLLGSLFLISHLFFESYQPLFSYLSLTHLCSCSFEASRVGRLRPMDGTVCYGSAGTWRFTLEEVHQNSFRGHAQHPDTRPLCIMAGKKPCKIQKQNGN